MTTEPEITGELNPDNEIDGLETAYDIASQEIQEQTQDLMEEQGYDPDEIEALFDPAPRRHHRRHHRRQTHRQVAYDPAPRRRSRRRETTGKKRRSSKRGSGIKKSIGGLLNYAGIIAGSTKFYLDYSARATTLKTAGSLLKDGTPVDGILKAIQYDMENFNSTDAMARVKTAAPTIVGEAVVGYIAKTSKVNSMLKGYGQPLGDAAYGVAGATLLKAFLDPPVGQPQVARRTVIQAQATQVQNAQVTAGAGWRV